jgi:hypothetical protein
LPKWTPTEEFSELPRLRNECGGQGMKNPNLEHTKELHTHLAEREAAHAKMHKAAMDAYEPDTAEHDFHKGMMERCLKDGAHHVACAKTAGEAMSRKAAGFADDLDDLKPFPDGLSRVAPTAPQHFAVPRHGAPPFPGSAATSSAFEKIYGTGTEE